MNERNMINIIKRYFLLLLTIVIASTISGCVEENEPDKPIEPVEVIEYLDIYSINDFHGAVEDYDGKGISRIGNYLINQKEANPQNTIILAAGDMFQGSGVSNLTFGGVVVEAMNFIGFDAMTIGNHEFDWGVDRLKSFHDETSEQVQASFPFLSANIYEKSTNQLVDWAQPYTIVNRGGVKVGIIGSIGEYQINSITASLVRDYTFKKPIPIIREIVRDLRVNQDVDFVIVSSHEYDDSFNSALNSLSGYYAVDAVINAHTHMTYSKTLRRPNSAPLPIVQAGSEGNNIGHIRLNIDFENKKVTSVTAKTIPVNPLLSNNHPEIDKIVNKALEKTLPILNEKIGTSGKKVYKNEVIQWGVNVIYQYSNADLAVVNSGAFRNGFPVFAGHNITVSDVYEWMPFDNMIKTSKLTKRQISQIIDNSSLVFSDNFNFYELSDDRLYTVATVDYVFEKDYYPFLSGIDQINLGEYFRDFLINAIKETRDNGQLWYAR